MVIDQFRNLIFRPFIVMPIPRSNLILLVKDLTCLVADDPHYKITIKPEQFVLNSSNNDPLVCQRTALYRRRPSSCISQHQNVSKMSFLQL